MENLAINRDVYKIKDSNWQPFLLYIQMKFQEKEKINQTKQFSLGNNPKNQIKIYQNE